MTSHYGEHEHERYVPEPSYPGRSDFARDRARVLHSAALRRLAAKTQVIMAGQDDFPRTRLTHTLEVAQISRELAASLGADPDVVDTAGLAHDLGHPPFGHNGEDALNQVAADIGGFEGNAQSFRVLTRLELKVFGDHRSFGLNLTRASLDAVVKYPWLRRPGLAKYNAYAADEGVFDWVRQDAPPRARCVEAQIMDIADDIAYCVHDLEDAIVSGSFAPESLADPSIVGEVAAAARATYAPDIDAAAIEAAIGRISGLDCWPRGFDHSARSSAALKNMTSSLIKRFCTSVQQATWQAYGAGPIARYSADLVIPETTRAEVSALKAITYVHVMRDNHERYAWERTVISDVVTGLLADSHLLQRPYADAWRQHEDPAARLRIVIDQVASLTDLSIVRWREELSA